LHESAIFTQMEFTSARKRAQARRDTQTGWPRHVHAHAADQPMRVNVAKGSPGGGERTLWWVGGAGDGVQWCGCGVARATVCGVVASYFRSPFVLHSPPHLFIQKCDSQPFPSDSTFFSLFFNSLLRFREHHRTSSLLSARLGVYYRDIRVLCARLRSLL